jgi:hypothetical protein
MNTTYTALTGIAGICLLIGCTAILSFRTEISLALRKSKIKNTNKSLRLNSLELFPEDNAFGKDRHQLTVPDKESIREEESHIATAHS